MKINLWLKWLKSATVMTIKDGLFLVEYRNAFNLYDREGKGRVPSRELGTVMRAVGYNPAQQHVQQLLNEVCRKLIYNSIIVITRRIQQYYCSVIGWILCVKIHLPSDTEDSLN